jgi:hypothetical protein
MAVKITEVPAQILAPVLAAIETAGTLFGFTLTVVEAQIVVLQVPLYLTK